MVEVVMHLKRLTKQERELCRSRGWGCGACDQAVEYVSDYAYASGSGHIAQITRPLCAEHARELAERFALLPALAA
jgi:hypothetical protein